MEPKQVLPFWVRVDLGIMTMKGFFTLSRSPEQEPFHQMQFSGIPRTPHSRGYHQLILSPADKFISILEEALSIIINIFN